jgi:hypothetical protein
MPASISIIYIWNTSCLHQPRTATSCLTPKFSPGIFPRHNSGTRGRNQQPLEISMFREVSHVSPYGNCMWFLQFTFQLSYFFRDTLQWIDTRPSNGIANWSRGISYELMSPPNIFGSTMVRGSGSHVQSLPFPWPFLSFRALSLCSSQAIRLIRTRRKLQI